MGKQVYRKGLTYLGFLENGVCECQQSDFKGHRCRALDRIDEKSMAIKRYVPAAVLVPADIRARTIEQLDDLIHILAQRLHKRENTQRAARLDCWHYI